MTELMNSFTSNIDSTDEDSLLELLFEEIHINVGSWKKQ